MKKKIIAGVLAASMCLAAASCDGPHFESTPEAPIVDTTETTETTGQLPPATDTTSAENPLPTDTTADPADVTTAEIPEQPVIVDNSMEDLEAVEVGKHITFVYNAASADVTWEVTKGVGSRESVTFSVTPRAGYLFDGWSEGDAIVNGRAAKSKELIYTVEVSSAKKIFLNTSIQLVYHENGGKIAKSGFDGTDTFSVVFHQNPNTLPAQNYFTRDGYTLTGYNTMADGSGEEVSLGSKVTATGNGTIDLYCVWEENAPEADFEVKNSGANVSITAYKGNAETVVIPAKIGGKNVIGIADGAFEKTAVKRVVIPSSVKEIEGYAFYNCESLDTVVLFDTIREIDDEAFSGCDALAHVRLNTQYGLTDDWFSSAAAKIDRLIWAKNKKKVIIIGGSGSLYGFDCAVLDEALDSEYEIINFGENANITSLVYFDIVEDFVQEGDIILWCPEPGSYTLGTTYCSSRFWDFRKSNYDFAKYINPAYYDNFFSSFASYSSSLSRVNFKDYDKLSVSMNKYGDDRSSRSWDRNKYSYNFDYDMQAKDELSEIVKNITDKGASVYYSFAAMQKSGMAGVDESSVKALEEIVTSVPGIVSISDYKDCIYEDDLFWNSAWHLTDEGGAVRAEQVAKDLLKALGKS